MARRDRSVRAETPGALRKLAAWCATPRGYAMVAVVLVVAALLARLPDAAASTEAFDGHPDANTYFNAAFAAYLRDDAPKRPLPHGGSGWPLALAGILDAVGVEPGRAMPRYATLPEGQRATLNAAVLSGPARQERWLDHFGTEGHRTALRVDYLASALHSTGVVAATFALGRALAPAPAALLAGALVAFDRDLVASAGDGMSEPLFSLVLLLAFVAAARARERPAWLLLAGALMAVAYAVRFNALVLLAALLLGAGVMLAPRLGIPRALGWGAAALAVAGLVAAPYVSWRAEYLPGPFDMGQNGDVWADGFWGPGSYADTTGDHYLKRRTFAEWREAHGWEDAAERLRDGAWMQGRDFLRAVSLPVLILAAFAAWRLRRDAAFAPIGLAVVLTFASLLWIYPLVASERYYHPLTPLLAVAGAAALASWARAASAERQSRLLGGIVVVLLVYGAWGMAGAARGLAWALSDGTGAALAGVGLAAIAGAAAGEAWRPRLRIPARRR